MNAGRTLLLVASVSLALCAPAPLRATPAAQASMPFVPPSPPIIPAPQSITPGDGAFTLTPTTPIVTSGGGEALRIGQSLSDLIGIAVAETRLRVAPATGSPPAGAILLELRPLQSTPGPEYYELTVTPERVTITATHPPGLFYGVQTLRQLLPPAIEYEALRPNPKQPIVIPSVRIVDKPRFGWRGAMLDVARHFMSVADVMRYIDLLALYKINRLHLHLADDQGWRIEIKSWPKLATEGGRTEVGGTPGGFYTQQDFRRLVAYAQERFITIVPEIDMPGHTNAALASYAELNCNKVAPAPYTGIEVGFSALCVDSDVTYRFIRDVVREIGALTPGQWFHIGGDEVKTLTAEKYAKFIDRVQEIVRAQGKQMIGWDEIAPASLLATTLVQHWRPDSTPVEAVKRGAKIILSPANKIYLDMKYDRSTPVGLDWAAVIEVRDAYSWDPATLLAGVPEESIVGVEAPLWSETTATMDDVEYLAFPRVIAAAEIGWSAADRRNWDDFRQRLGAHGPRLTALGVNFYRSPQVPWR